MKQLTKKQAIKIGESGIWKDWTDQEIVEFQLWQNRFCTNFQQFHEALEKVLNRPVLIHEFSLTNINNLRAEYSKNKKKPTFDDIIRLIPKEKRILVLT